MQIVKKKILAIAGLFVLLGTTACQKWTDDTPQPLEVDESKIFSTEKGFREVLNGVYLQMGAPSLYGRDLTMGALSLAGRSYDSVSLKKVGYTYYQAATLNLNDASIKGYSADVWNKMYSAIANVNNVLANIDNKQSIFTGDNYNTVKGEALALRAYLHFDLLRLFAPAPALEGFTNAAIPYVTVNDYKATPVSTVGQVFDQCIADLAEADRLLDDNSLATSQVNSWAVKGLMARLYLYKGDKTKASEYASAVINNPKISLSTTKADLLFANESLFKLNVFGLNFYALRKSVFGSPALIGTSVSAQSALYGATTTDYRKAFSITLDDATKTGGIIPAKLAQSSANVFPMIRLTEMYYIAAECTDDIPTALGYLNTVRKARGIIVDLTPATVTDAAALSTEILNEYRKEFVGEGQVFFYYKRNNTAFTSLPFYTNNVEKPPLGLVAVVPNATYTFVKPE
ncbi:hypothetical protein C3K47_04310 [Solitalea longa]|uniref:RagB/SusD family nutrient uptake outer membrane protein n=1 Tax=Solitalea longa TaxID=2079460 RepID=A0A2S5A7Y4_9SPHI|nr:RagB/SusD family nutrient uptake outer membrane protein [Solitalea longa]POY38624.1 hypothetical protein C3K47_04310 [Solitalea longa]